MYFEVRFCYPNSVMIKEFCWITLSIHRNIMSLLCGLEVDLSMWGRGHWNHPHTSSVDNWTKPETSVTLAQGVYCLSFFVLFFPFFKNKIQEVGNSVKTGQLTNSFFLVSYHYHTSKFIFLLQTWFGDPWISSFQPITHAAFLCGSSI